MASIDAAKEIERLIQFGLGADMIDKLDVIPVRNGLMDLLKIKEPYYGEIEHEEMDSPAAILEKILDYSAEAGIIRDNTVTYRDLLDARIMGFLMPRQSEVAENFWRTKERLGIQKATDDFYSLSRCSNYIRMDRIASNLYWRGNTEYGSLEITINLSKPEKDPKEIAAAKQMPEGRYPKCLLCLENVGYSGNLNHTARQNHRVIPLVLNGENWYFQYSPYVYYNEHCIVFKEQHIPMKISEKTFLRLFDFIEQFPHYFIGSNADIPIVGGSILVHEHFQGGRHVFSMEEAPVEKYFMHKYFPDVKAGIVKWPLSVIRICGNNRSVLTETAIMILNKWKEYSDESMDILAYTENGDVKIPHNTVTPIARKNKNGEFEMDLVLRNNRTSKLHPEGIFHPHRELHHIKKENIGLIEVMGLAVLPGRLDTELKQIAQVLTGEVTYSKQRYADESNPLHKHQSWIDEMVIKYGMNLKHEEARTCLENEVTDKFLQVLLDAGVYKRNAGGMEAFLRFMDALGFKEL